MREAAVTGSATTAITVEVEEPETVVIVVNGMATGTGVASTAEAPRSADFVVGM